MVSWKSALLLACLLCVSCVEVEKHHHHHHKDEDSESQETSANTDSKGSGKEDEDEETHHHHHHHHHHHQAADDTEQKNENPSANQQPTSKQTGQSGQMVSQTEANSQMQSIQKALGSTPQAQSLLQAAIKDVAENPAARQAVNTLMGLMSSPTGLSTVMTSLHELMSGSRDGPGLRTLGGSLGLTPAEVNQVPIPGMGPGQTQQQATPPQSQSMPSMGGGGAPNLSPDMISQLMGMMKGGGTPNAAAHPVGGTGTAPNDSGDNPAVSIAAALSSNLKMNNPAQHSNAASGSDMGYFGGPAQVAQADTQQGTGLTHNGQADLAKMVSALRQTGTAPTAGIVEQMASQVGQRHDNSVPGMPSLGQLGSIMGNIGQSQMDAVNPSNFHP